MGLWDWVFRMISGPAARQQQTATSTDRRRAAHQSATVATLDPADASTSPKSAGEKEQSPWWVPAEPTTAPSVLPERPELDAEARALENLLVSHFDGHNLNLPPLAQAAEQALAKLRDPKSSLADVARAIGEDPVIAAAVLRMANSAYYRGAEKITSLQTAASRLGTRALRTLMLHESMRSAVFQGRGADDWAELLWARSIAAAEVMRKLSSLTGLNEEDAALMGLLHDIGNVIVLRVVRGDRAVGGYTYEIDHDTFEYFCAICHQEFGELIADAWKLPDDLRALVTDHHSQPAPGDPLAKARWQLQLTDMILSLLGYMPYVPIDLLNTEAARQLNLAQHPGMVALLEKLPDDLRDAFD